MYDRDTKTCRLAFEVRNEVKEPEKPVFIKSWKLAVLVVVEVINKA